MKRIVTLCVSAIVPLALFADEPSPKQGKEDPKAEWKVPDKAKRDPWNGFPTGSWIVLSETRKLGETITTKRQKFVQAGRSVSVYDERGDAFSDESSSSLFHIAGGYPDKNQGFRIVDSQTKELVIDGEKVECNVTRYRLEMVEKRIVINITFWRSDKISVPYRELQPAGGRDIALMPNVLRVEYATRGPTRQETMILSVDRQEEIVNIGKRKIKCFRETGKGETTRNGMKTVWSVVRLLSDKVPGRVVKSSSSGTFKGTMFSRERMVTDFGVPEKDDSEAK